MKVIGSLLLGLVVFVWSISAWNATGHKIISAMAYDQLIPATRARVDSLISSHPDYQSHFLRDVPADATPAIRARWAFINASVWPDQIRDDPRFYNEERADAKPTPALPGFPDMGRHTRWHYINSTVYAGWNSSAQRGNAGTRSAGKSSGLKSRSPSLQDRRPTRHTRCLGWCIYRKTCITQFTPWLDSPRTIRWEIAAGISSLLNQEEICTHFGMHWEEPIRKRPFI